MGFEARMRAITERTRGESDAVDPASMKGHPLTQAVVSRTAMIPNSEAPAAQEFARHTAQVMASDPDIENHQALLQQKRP